jgi:hypothetical protein
MMAHTWTSIYGGISIACLILYFILEPHQLDKCLMLYTVSQSLLSQMLQAMLLCADDKLFVLQIRTPLVNG